MARRIEEARAAAATAVKEAGVLLAALSEHRPGSRPEIGKAMDALKARAEELTDAKVPGTLSFLADALDRLANAVDGSDQAPSPDAVSGFEQVHTSLDRALTAWNALKSGELAGLNRQLKNAGQPEISLNPPPTVK
jgi:hypothetical protein